MGKMKGLFEGDRNPLYKPLGLQEPNDLSVEIANRILKAGRDALELARIAKVIRRERVIRVCAWHEPEQAWWDGEEWVVGNIPPGRQTHTLCPECFEKAKTEIKAGQIPKTKEPDPHPNCR